MKKTILILALFIGLLITSSGFNKTSLNTSIGKQAPILAIDKIENVIDKSEKEGNYVLLSFWSTTDGASRMSVNNYNKWMNNLRPENVDFVSVNFDKSERLFNEIVKRDGLDDSQQFNVCGNQAKQIIRDYHLDKGYGSILISPEGTIISHNPSYNELANIAKG